MRILQKNKPLECHAQKGWDWKEERRKPQKRE